MNNQTPESAATQFGYNNDYVGVIPTGHQRALLVTNHEYTDENLMFPTGQYDAATIKQIAIASHGMSVVEIKHGSRRGSWTTVNHRHAKRNRRLTADSPFLLDGPAAGDSRLKTSQDPSGRRVRGTFNNCSGGMTPWGTVLSGEENFNGYFDASGPLDPRYTASYQRYGITGVGGRGWSEVDPRFDLAKEPHEPFRFGWIVELDPLTRRRHRASTRCSAGSSTRAPTSRSLATARPSPTWATTSAATTSTSSSRRRRSTRGAGRRPGGTT